MNKKAWLQDIKSSIAWILAILASLISAMSIIKLVLLVFDIGLVPVLDTIVTYYKDILNPFYEIIRIILWFVNIPDWIIDLFIIYIVGIGITFRTFLSVNETSELIIPFTVMTHKQYATEQRLKEREFMRKLLGKVIVRDGSSLKRIFRHVILKPYNFSIIRLMIVFLYKVDPEQQAESTAKDRASSEVLSPTEYQCIYETTLQYFQTRVSIARRCVLSIALIPIAILLFFAFNKLS